jgi:hypothetical protein
MFDTILLQAPPFRSIAAQPPTITQTYTPCVCFIHPYDINATLKPFSIKYEAEFRSQKCPGFLYMKGIRHLVGLGVEEKIISKQN